MKDFLTRNKWPLIVAAVAVLVRLIYLLELSRLPGFSVPMVDEKWHWLWAQEILERSFRGEGAYFRAPLYPYFLALLHKITGGSIFYSKFLQLFLSGGTAFFTYRLAERLFNHTTAVVAGILYALYGTLIFYEAAFLIPVVFLFFLVWGMYRLVAYQDSTSWTKWLVTGIVFGLAAISRPNVLLVVPFLMVWMLVRGKDAGAFLRRATLPLIFLTGVTIPIAPVTVRNAVVTGDFMLISSQGGINLYLGNNVAADGLTMLMPEVDLDESVSWRQFGAVTRSAAEREAGRELSEAELSSFWTGKAVDFMFHNPGGFLTLVWKKTVYLLSGFENSDNADIYYQRTRSRLYSVLLWDRLVYFPFGVLLPLTAAGIYLTRRHFRKLLPLYIFILAYVPSIVLFLVTARHRLPLVPFMIVIASAGLVSLASQIRKPNMKQLSPALGIVIVLLLVFNRTYYDEGKGSDFQIHFNNGIRYEQLEDYTKAEQEYLLADQSYPYSAALINNLAHVQFSLGKHSDADRNYHRAIKLKPGYARVYSNLGWLVQKRGNPDSALILYRMALKRYDPDLAAANELSQIYLNMAGAYDANSMIDSAMAAHEKAVEAGPRFHKAHFQAATLCARHGYHERADSLYSAGRHLHDLSASDYFNWGASLMQRREFAGGLSMMRRALKRDSSLYQAYYSIAAAYLENGQPLDSIYRYLRLCLRHNADYQPAQELIERLDEEE